jgi:hypothetical protein
VHSNCIRSGDVCSKFCIPTKQIEQNKFCANWIPLMLNEGWHATNVLLATADIQWSRREGAVYLSCILKVEESWMHSYRARLKFESAESQSLMLPQKIVVRKSQGTLKVMDDMFFYKWLVFDHTVPLGTSVIGANYAQLLHVNMWPSLCQNSNSCWNMVSSSGQCDTLLPLWHPGLAAGLRLGSLCTSSMLSRSCFLGILFFLTSRNH